MDNKPGPTKVFDVGQPQSSPTSKPIIVGHRPVMTDPMVHRPLAQASQPPAKADINPPVGPASLAPPAGAVLSPQSTPPRIHPSSHMAKTVAVSEEKQDEILKATKPFDLKLAEETSAQTAPAPTAPAAGAASPALTAALEAELAQPDPLPTPAAPHIHSLPVSHGSPHSSDRLRFILIWAVSIIVVLFIGAYLFIDAGIIKSNINLPFHIFNGQTSG